MMRTFAIAVLLSVAGVCVGQQAEFKMNPTTVVSFRVVKNGADVVVCDAGEPPHNCKLQNGYSLDDVMQAWLDSSRQTSDAWQAENRDLEKRLCISIDLLKALTHNKTKTPGCEKAKLENKKPQP